MICKLCMFSLKIATENKIYEIIEKTGGKPIYTADACYSPAEVYEKD